MIVGFTGAGILINTSFQSWAESPVKTTIETLPITEITFPKVTVCPPKNTFNDLNYDLLMTEKMTLDNDTRQELANYAVELLYDRLYDDIMRNMSKLEENDRYYNWYHGYTEIKLPYIRYDGDNSYYMNTAASSGSVTTQYFGEEFDADKVETGPLYYLINVWPPASVRNNPKVTLHLDIEKVSMEDLSSGQDRLRVGYTTIIETHKTFNYTPPKGGNTEYYSIELSRRVIPADLRKQKLNMMSGFRVSWRYSGVEVVPEAKYYNNSEYYPSTMAFIRNFSNSSHMWSASAPSTPCSATPRWSTAASAGTATPSTPGATSWPWRRPGAWRGRGRGSPWRCPRPGRGRGRRAGAGRCGPTCTGSTPPRAWRAWPPTGGSPGGLAPTPCGLRTRATTSSTATSRFMSSTKFPVCNKNYKIKSIDLNESNTNTLSRGYLGI